MTISIKILMAPDDSHYDNNDNNGNDNNHDDDRNNVVIMSSKRRKISCPRARLQLSQRRLQHSGRATWRLETRRRLGYLAAALYQPTLMNFKAEAAYHILLYSQ